MSAKSLPSAAQARMLARLWSGEHTVNVMIAAGDGRPPYVDPTTAALVKRGWVKPDGTPKKNEGGWEYQPHVLTESGIDALEDFLRRARQDRIMAKVHQGSTP